jgi:hypothetical protein
MPGVMVEGAPLFPLCDSDEDLTTDHYPPATSGERGKMTNSSLILWAGCRCQRRV